MKKQLMLTLIAACMLAVGILAVGCVSTKSAFSSRDEAAIEEVAAKWIDSLKSEDIDALLSTYWDDMTHITYEADGSKTSYTVEEIRIEQQAAFDQHDLFAGLEYPEPERDFTTEPCRPIYVYTVTIEDFRFQDIFQFLKRDGEWRIIEHVFRAIP